MSLPSKFTQRKEAVIESGTDDENDLEEHQDEPHKDEYEDTDVINDQMSMEELLALQEKIGTKAFSKQIMKKNEIVSKPRKKISYKRENKNRPREMPLQRGAAPRMKFLDRQKPSVKPPVYRDPRFDDLSGKLDIVAWKKNYDFIGEKRRKELQTLKKSMKKIKNPEKLTKIKDTVQRMENQDREHDKQNKEREIKKRERETIISSLKEGKAPRYTSKKEKYLSMKMSQFDQLKDKKKFDKYVQRKEKKLLKQSKI